MSPSLWPHQLAAIAATENAIIDHQPTGLWSLPTGTGKTYAFLALARGLGAPTLVLVHRAELLEQTLQSAAEIWPEASVGVIQGPRDDWQGRDLVIASVPSLQAGRLEGLPRDQYRLLVVDECHHLPAPSWGRVVEHFTPGFLLGVTATPDRLDGQGLAPWFGPHPLYTYELRQAIADEVLVPVRQFAVRTRIDLDAVPLQGGDFDQAALARAVASVARDQAIVEAYQAHAAGRKAIAFATDRAHVERLTEAFRAGGVATTAVTGDLHLRQRRQRLADFADGLFQVLVNCEICTEGYDERSISCVVMARPMQSRSLYQQCVGRGLRIAPGTGKQDCLVLDVTDNCRRHKLVTADDLFGTPAAAASGGASQGPGRQEAVQGVEPVVADPGPVVWWSQEVPPWPETPSLDGYRPREWWHGDPATDTQINALRRFGLEVVRDLTKGEANHLLYQCKSFAEREPATARQQWYLRHAGAWEPGLTKREASQRIGRLKAGQVG
jgi:superfamily II DNA or RNA helicase